MNKEKVKKFVKKHKKVICGTGIILGTLVCGSVIGSNITKRKIFKKEFILDDESMIHVLKDADLNIGAPVLAAAIHEKGGLKCSDMGKLGEAIKSFGAPEDQTFTHFIALGNDIDS